MSLHEKNDGLNDFKIEKLQAKQTDKPSYPPSLNSMHAGQSITHVFCHLLTCLKATFSKMFFQ